MKNIRNAITHAAWEFVMLPDYSPHDPPAWRLLKNAVEDSINPIKDIWE